MKFKINDIVEVVSDGSVMGIDSNVRVGDKAKIINIEKQDGSLLYQLENNNWKLNYYFFSYEIKQTTKEEIMILSETFNDELQKYSTLDLLRMLKEYEDYNDSGVCDDGGIRGIVEDFVNNNPSSLFPVVSMAVALEISVVLLSRFNHID